MKVTYISEKKPTLEKLQEIVGGYIQVVDLENNKQMIVNEEGSLVGLEINNEATLLAREKGIPMHDYIIVGDVAVLSDEALLD
tara:strand:- start:11958 stop:12206 length:249 start_codon:yes stop_codon:yes gene_type:complete